jgi:hypothetical protein
VDNLLDRISTLRSRDIAARAEERRRDREWFEFVMWILVEEFERNSKISPVQIEEKTVVFETICSLGRPFDPPP